jgi:hypothetical protein
MKAHRRPTVSNKWTADDIAVAARMYRHGGATRRRSLELIATTLGRTLASVASRANVYGPSFANPRIASISEHSEGWFVPESVLAEREQRQALEPQSLTAALMNDPLPGCSALDRRRS